MNEIIDALPVPYRVVMNLGARPPGATRRSNEPAAPSGTIATRRWRRRFRRELERMAATNPHLIDDIGLTRRQVEAEIGKWFWQA